MTKITNQYKNDKNSNNAFAVLSLWDTAFSVSALVKDLLLCDDLLVSLFCDCLYFWTYLW